MVPEKESESRVGPTDVERDSVMESSSDKTASISVAMNISEAMRLNEQRERDWRSTWSIQTPGPS